MRTATQKEKQAFLDGISNYIIKKTEEKEGFKLLILGILVGILGSFIANLFYKISESFEVFYFWLINLLIVIIFIILVIVIIVKYYSFSKEIREFENHKDEIFKKGLIIDSDKPIF